MKANHEIQSGSSVPNRKSPFRFQRDVVAIVESNIDDITGEVLASAIEHLMEAGAYDTTATTYLGKKGRLGHTIRVVCTPDSAERFAQMMVEETGTLGVKTTEYARLIIPRRTVSVPVSIEGFNGSVSVKIAEFNGKILRVKPELSDAKEISETQKIPLREVLERINSAARIYVSGNSLKESDESEVNSSVH